MTFKPEYRFVPLWSLTFILSLAGVWIPLYLRATGDPISSNPLENGSLYVFSFVFVFAAFGSLVNDIFQLPDYKITSSEAVVSFGVAALIALLGGTKYGALVTQPAPADPDMVLPVILAGFASGYGFVSEYMRNGLRVKATSK